MSRSGMGDGRRPASLVKILVLLSLLCPLVFLVAVFGTRLGAWSLSFGFEVLALQVGRVLAWVGAAAALLAGVIALRHLRQAGIYAAVAVVAAVGSLAAYQVQLARYAAPGGADVTTDAAEPPAFSRAVMAERGGVQTRPQTCSGLEPVMRQVAPETASYAMREAGFTALGTAAFRADGYRESFWFGQVHHVAIRIRPGRTDVRVAARYPVPAGDEACRLARAVVAQLQP